MGTKSTIGTAGVGRMGRGIAAACAFGGHRVVMIDLKQRDAVSRGRVADDAMSEVRQTIRFLARICAIDEDNVDQIAALIDIAHADVAPSILDECNIIFEAVPETIHAKRQAFALIGTHARPDAVIASTTSTIGVEELVPLVRHPERLLNAHWLNPAYLMPLVEVSPSSVTDPYVVTRLEALLRDIGKVPIICKASPGYIVPRIQALAIAEAARLVQEGVASARDVDTAIKLGFGIRFAVLGMLEFVDWGGGDILYYATRFLSESIDPHRFETPPIVDENMRAKRRGLQDGIGFHDYTDVDVKAYREKRQLEFAGLLGYLGLMPTRGSPTSASPADASRAK